MGLNKGYPGYMQVNHGGLYCGMSQQFFYGDNVYPFFQKVGSIAVPQRMQVYSFLNGGFLQSFPHNPAQAFGAVPAIGFFTVEKPCVRMFYP
jgi:hypothetical protein